MSLQNSAFSLSSDDLSLVMYTCTFSPLTRTTNNTRLGLRRQRDTSVGKGATTKPDDLSSIPGAHLVEREKLTLASCSLTASQMMCHLCTLMHMHACTYIKINRQMKK